MNPELDISPPSEQVIPGGFEVSLKDTDAIQDYILNTEKLVKSGTGMASPQLPLGEITINDNLFKGIELGINLNHGNSSYTLFAMMESPLPVGANAAPEALLSLVSQMVVGQTISPEILNNDLDFERLAKYVKSSMTKDMEEVSVNGRELSLKDYGGSVYHLMEGFSQHGTRAYILGGNGSSADNNHDFQRVRENHAQILKRVVDYAYLSQGSLSPQISLESQPPQGLQQANERLRKALSGGVGENALGVSDESLRDEVRRTIKQSEKPTTTFNDIAGHKEAKEALESAADYVLDPEIFRSEGTKPPGGILLYGPSGTGKTELSKALANKMDAELYIVDLSSIVHPLYGKMEKLLDMVFEMAEEDEAALVLIDEFDALATQRDMSSETNSRMVNVIATRLDGLRERKGKVTVVGATNRLHAIDPAFKRPGRFDVLIEVGLPTYDEIPEVYGIHMSKAEDLAGRTLFDSDLDMNLISQKSKGLSGADMQEIIRRVLNKNVKMRQKGQVPGMVTTARILSEIESYEPVRKDAAKKIGFETG